MTEAKDLPPWQLGAVDVATQIADGTLRVQELVSSLIERIAALDPQLHAWVTVDAEKALAMAAKMDALPRTAPTSPLAGVPIGLKDIFYTRGLRTTAGSKVLSDFVPDHDATAVAKLRDADVVILGKVETCEFANGDPSVVRNPWNIEHTPGGSSSGSAVAVATGTVPISLGSQTGGSTLRPAAYNGVVGLKPSYGLISNYGVIPLAWSFDHVGIFARSVRDAELVLQTVAGYDPLDPASVAVFSDSFRPLNVRSGPPVLGLIRSYFMDDCDPETRETIDRVAELFEARGAEVREIEMPEIFERISATYPRISEAETASYHSEEYARSGGLYGPQIAAMIERGERSTVIDYVRAQRERTSLVRELERKLADTGADVFLMPTVPSPAPRDLLSTGDPSYLVPWSFAGLPAISIPVGLSRNGLPMAAQLVGHRWRDASLLAVAGWAEAVLDFSEHPPSW